MRRAGLNLGFLLSFLLFLILLPVASAARPSPPAIVTTETEDPILYGQSGFVYGGNVTWQLAVEDPGPGAPGAINYTVYANFSTVATSGGYLAQKYGPPGCGTCPQTYTSLGNRWASARIFPNADTTPRDATGAWVQNYNVTANATGASLSGYDGESVPSCLVTNYLGLPLKTASHDQCGGTLSDPSGQDVTVLNVGNRTVPTQLNLRVNLSPDDAVGNGNFSYRTFLFTDAYNISKPGADLGYATITTGGGIIYRNITLSATPPSAIYIAWRAENGTTRLWSNVSCVTTTNPRVVLGYAACGVLGATTGTVTGPSFPLLDVAVWTAATGWDSTLVPWVLAGVLVFACTIGGFAIAQGIGAGVSFLASLPLAYYANLLPQWFLIIAYFFLALAAVFLLASKGSGSAEG